MSNDIFLTNNLTNKKEKFVPIDEQNIRMYVCGPTVYDDPHIGNARPIVVFDILYKIFKKKYSKVTYVRNITDVDDKIIKSSKENNISISELTNKVTESFGEDCNYLNCETPTHQPKATENIDLMIEMVSELIKKGFAYENNNHVYFEVKKFNDYGQLSNKKLEDLIAGSRIEISENKKNSEDFVLWKPSASDEPSWDSPWGKGRPGWHIECSSMVLNTIGDTVDIHGGGIDLIFPHHENEIAQSESLNGKKFANIWMHNGMVKIQGEKMSKSLGNLIKLKDAIEIFGADLLRMWILSSHYRKPLLYDEKIINSFSKPLKRIKDAINAISINSDSKLESSKEFDKFNLALSNDLNTSVALSQIISLSKKINNFSKEFDISIAQNDLKKMLEITGLCQKTKSEINNNEFIDREIDDLLEKRNEFRKSKEFIMADKIRDQLLEKGIEIIDNGFKSTWKKT